MTARRPRIGIQLPEVERRAGWPEYLAMARRRRRAVSAQHPDPDPDPQPHSHCHACGAPFASDVGNRWPRRCAACATVSYRNPLPVAVMVIPVAGAGLLMVQRAIAPRGLAFPGGFVEWGEGWQAAAARELREETGVHVDPETIEAVAVRSAPDGTLLVFGSAPPVPRAALDAFAPSDEVEGLVLVDTPRDDVVFPLHAEVLAERLGPHPRPSAQ